MSGAEEYELDDDFAEPVRVAMPESHAGDEGHPVNTNAAPESGSGTAPVGAGGVEAAHAEVGGGPDKDAAFGQLSRVRTPDSRPPRGRLCFRRAHGPSPLPCACPHPLQPGFSGHQIFPLLALPSTLGQTPGPRPGALIVTRRPG